MATIRNDKTIIKITWNKKTQLIKAENVKDTDKQDIEKTYACDDHEPNYITFGKCEYSIDLSGVQSHRWLFEKIRITQQAGNFNNNYPSLQTFHYDGKGKPVLDKYYSAVFVEEISGEGQEPFDVKLVPMKRIYQNSKGGFLG